METMNKAAITVETIVKAPVEKVWKYWTSAKHITRWCNASDDWHVPFAENDLKVGGKFKTTMASKDGTSQFDFEGTYSSVTENKDIGYEIIDGRKVKVTFTPEGNGTKITETFEIESVNSPELQKSGWQSILDNFKRYTEAN